MASEAGKGSTPRAPQVPQHVVDENWDNIFSKKQKESTEEDEPRVDGDSPNE